MMTIKLDADLREDPRYPVSDLRVSVATGDSSTAAKVADISLNGALVDCEAAPACSAGDGVSLSFTRPDQKPFAATARVIHVRGQRMGLEFLAFDPADFDVLVELIGELRRARVAQLLAARGAVRDPS